MGDATQQPPAVGTPQPMPAPAPAVDGAAPGSASWPPWTAPAALVSALVLAAVGALIVDIPAVAAGVKITTSRVPPGLEIADTAVQDFVFVFVAAFFAQLGGRGVSAWQLGLRPTRFWRAARLVVLTLLGFLVFAVVWGTIFHAEKEKLLKQLGTEESTLLLVLSAGLTCVIAPICEEVLFRGFIFTALRNWRGTWPAAILTGLAFGGVHAGSAPAVDLIPLAVLGFALCLLYRATGSLYPCIAAHSLNNSVAFASLMDWGWQIPVLMFASLGTIALLALALMRAGIISAPPRDRPAGVVAVSP